MLGEVGGAYHGDVGMLEQEWLDRLVAAHRRTSVTSRERPELTKPLGYGRREAYLKELRTRANTHRSNGAVTNGRGMKLSRLQDGMLQVEAQEIRRRAWEWRVARARGEVNLSTHVGAHDQYELGCAALVGPMQTHIEF